MKRIYTAILFLFFSSNVYADITSPVSRYYFQYNVLVNLSSELTDDRIGTDKDGAPVYLVDTYTLKDNNLIPIGSIAFGVTINRHFSTELELGTYEMHYTFSETNQALVRNLDSDRPYTHIDYMLSILQANLFTYKGFTFLAKAGVGMAFINQPKINFDGGRAPSFAYLLGSGASYEIGKYLAAEVGVRYFRNMPKRLVTSSSGGSSVKATVKHLTAYFGIKFLI